MIITQIKLFNFGPFKGGHTFDLEPKAKKPIVIIMGHNGAGKTTLLEALQLGIYGPLSFGLKSMTPRYQSYVKQKLNRQAKKENLESKFQVNISFRWKSGRETETIELKRHWESDTLGRLQETVIVLRDGNVLESTESFEVEERIRATIPPAMMQFFLFDGERIDYLLRNSDFSSLLQDGVMNMFGLDLIDSLKQDLGSTFNHEDMQKKMKSDEQALHSLRQEIERVEKEAGELFSLIGILERKIEENKQLKDTLFQEYKLNGGLIVEEQVMIEHRIKEKDELRSKINEQIKQSIANHLPFKMISSLLEKTINQVTGENQVKALNAAYSILAEQKQNLIKEWSNLSPNKSTNDELPLFFSFMIEKLVLQQTTGFLHDLSEADLIKLKHVQIEIKKISEQNFRSLFKTISECTTEIQTLRRKLEKSLAETALKNTWDEIEKINTEITNNQITLLTIQDQTNQILVTLEELKIQREKDVLRVNESQRDESMYKLAEKIQNLMHEFQSKSLKQQVSFLSNEIKKQFVQLMQKKEYVKSIYIDPQSFELKMYGKGNVEVMPSIMSAGERQLLLLAIIQAFLVVSGRQIPLVLDTLLGRLDLKHRDAIISRFLANTTFQTIVLATDSEISPSDIEHLQDNISMVYEITYSEQTGVSEANKRGA